MKLFKKQEIESAGTDSTALGPVLCSLQPYEPNGLSLEEQGYIKVPGDAISHATAALQYMPGQAVASLSTGLYKAVFDQGLGVLQKSAQHPGLYLGNVVSPEANNAIRDVAVWQEVTAAPQIALGIFTAVSIVTGQYFMAQTNKKLSTLANGVMAVKQLLEEDDYRELTTSHQYFQSIQASLSSIMENDTLRQTATNTVTARMLSCKKIADKYRDVIKEIQLNGKKEQLASSIGDLSKYLSVYHAALELYCIAIYLVTMLSQNTDPVHIHNLEADVSSLQSRYLEDLVAWNASFSKQLESASAFRLDRFLLHRYDSNFWSRPVNAAKDVLLAKRSFQPKDAEKQLHEVMRMHDDATAFDAVSEGLKMIDRLYNKPVEAVIAENSLYIRPIQTEEVGT